MGEQETEIRFWLIFAGEEEGAAGYVVRKNEMGSLAVVYDISSRRRVDHRRVATPRSGWQKFWVEVDEFDLLRIPDERELATRVDAVHGIWISAEVKSGNRYSRFWYNNPWLLKTSRPHRKAVELAEFLAREIGEQ